MTLEQISRLYEDVDYAKTIISNPKLTYFDTRLNKSILEAVLDGYPEKLSDYDKNKLEDTVKMVLNLKTT